MTEPRPKSTAQGCAKDASSVPAPPDSGPWMVNEWSGGRVVLQSDDFKHDVALVVDGDFGSREDKLTYANALATWMNANLSAAPGAAANN
ncbi:hypothetical protein [Burkholderia ubonensis]|nr:hypothetical protein [Burkholderia ubonensis]